MEDFKHADVPRGTETHQSCQRLIKKIPFCLRLNLPTSVALRCQQSGGGTVRTHGSHQLSSRIPPPRCQRDPHRARPAPSPQHVGAPPAEAAVPPRHPPGKSPAVPAPYSPAASGPAPPGGSRSSARGAGGAGRGGGRAAAGPHGAPGCCIEGFGVRGLPGKVGVGVGEGERRSHPRGGCARWAGSVGVSEDGEGTALGGPWGAGGGERAVR